MNSGNDNENKDGLDVALNQEGEDEEYCYVNGEKSYYTPKAEPTLSKNGKRIGRPPKPRGPKPVFFNDAPLEPAPSEPKSRAEWRTDLAEELMDALLQRVLARLKSSKCRAQDIDVAVKLLLRSGFKVEPNPIAKEIREKERSEQIIRDLLANRRPLPDPDIPFDPQPTDERNDEDE